MGTNPQRLLTGLCLLAVLMTWSLRPFAADLKPVLNTHIQVTNAYINLPIRGKTTTAGYLTLHNAAAKAQILVAVTTGIAERAEIHSHTHVNGKMQMRREEQVAIPANSTLEFAPGAWHLMFFGVSDQLKTGDELHLILRFADGSQLPVTARARSLFDKAHH